MAAQNDPNQFMNDLGNHDDLIHNLREKAKKLTTFPVHGNCQACGKRAKLACAKCHHRFYCNRHCQAKVFSQHKRECYALDKKLLQDGENQVLLEAFNMNLFSEYQAISSNIASGRTNPEYLAEHMIYEGIIGMILVDPKYADLPCDDIGKVDRFTKAQEKIKKAAILLVENGRGEVMYDYQDNPFIPRRLKRDIDFLWNGIGSWKC